VAKVKRTITAESAQAALDLQQGFEAGAASITTGIALKAAQTGIVTA